MKVASVCFGLAGTIAVLSGGAFAQELDFSRITAREATRLARQDPSTAVEAAAGPRQQPTTTSDWSRVIALAPGREIRLTTTRATSRHRLLKVDETTLTMLDVSDPAIPPSVGRLLTRTAERHPDYFVEAQRGDGFRLDDDVRLDAEGVSQKGRTLAELARVVATVPRDEVVEVRILQKHIGRHAKRGLVIGATGGAVVGAISAASCDARSEPAYCDVGGMAAVGAIMGALVGLEYGTIIGIIVPRSWDLVYSR
jgi:hypothetical protein